MGNGPETDKQDAFEAWGLVLVAFQFAGLAYLGFSGPIVPQSDVLMGVALAGIALGVWAIVMMRPQNVNVAPRVKKGSRLVTRGPYRWIRHPMYTALLLMTSAWLAGYYTPLRLLVWVLFVANMIVKLTVEERHLERHFPSFAEYKQRTRRLIPFVF